MPLKRSFAFVLASALLLTAGAAAADEKEVCVQAVERAQVVRLDGKLIEAREGFVTCARAVCPAAIRQDCTRWVAEVDASLPSVVFEAVWADGRDATGMTVVLDGKPLEGAEPGRAVPMDPGEHSFRFEVAGAAPVESRNVIRQGEKNRLLRVTFTPLAAPAPPTPAVVTPPPAPSPSPSSTAAPVGLWRPPSDRVTPSPARRPIPLAAWVLGGVAVAGLGGLAYFGLKGTGDLDSMRSSCGHACNPSDVTAARNQILVGDVLGAVGLVAAGAAVWLTLAR
jgi:hypothetical protein